MEKFPATLRFPTPRSTRSDETEESSSTSTQETEENQATTDDTQHPSNVSDDPGTSNFWEGGRAQSVLEVLGVPSEDIAPLLNALPLSAFDKLFSGDPPPLRVTFHPDDKRPMLAWWNGALSDSTLEALVDVCRGHGTFLDRGELHQIVAFIQGGGMDRSRQAELEEIREEQRRLLALDPDRAPTEAIPVGWSDPALNQLLAALRDPPVRR